MATQCMIPLHEMPEWVNPQRQKANQQFLGAGDGGQGGAPVTEYKVSFWDNQSVLELGKTKGHTAL